MSAGKITPIMIDAFRQHLHEDERSHATIEKYMHDIKFFVIYAAGKVIDKSLIMEYKAALKEKYAVSSANSMLAALNTFLRFIGWNSLCVKQFKVQKKTYLSEDKELTEREYRRLLSAAKKTQNTRIALILQTICASGIRVSELKYITAEAVHKGEAIVTCKSKTRTVFIVSKLRKMLLQYMKNNNITSGAVFITKNGKPMDRSNIWREMKALCKSAGVSPSKVFPHNLRHLFARTFYGLEKDVAKLADILGHASIDTTRIYIITTGAEHRRQMEEMRLIM